MSFRQWSIGRFTVEEQAEELHLVAAGGRDRIRIRVGADSLQVDQKRTVGSASVIAMSEIATLRPEMIGGRKTLTWAVKALLRDGREMLLVHSVTEAEARGLAGALREHCTAVNNSRGLPPPPGTEGEQPDTWRLEEWRKQPPIG